ncbi:MAG: hypothetical protein GY861_05460 [bacterium]|nr:hypothetical protein [bacterium]
MLITPLTNQVNKTSPDISKQIYKDQQLRSLKNLKDLREAIEYAEDIDFPDRYELIGVYKDTELDCHVTGVRDSILNMIKSREYNLCDDQGEPDEEATRLLKTQWFFDYLKHMLDGFFHGYTLLQITEIKNGEITKIKNQPREYIVPEWEMMKLDWSTSSKQSGIYFLEQNPYKNFMLWYNTKGLGLYANVSPHAISKKHLLILALEKAEMFGMPIRIGKTDINDPKLRNQMESMLENMGASAWAVLDNKQDLELISNSQGDVHKIFVEPMKMSNQEISKAMAGAVGIFDEKSFVGSSEAGERLLGYFVAQYQVSIQFEINNVLLPVMRNLKLMKDGLWFKWEEVERLTVNDKVDNIAKLSPYYEIDAEEVETQTGIKVEGSKSDVMTETENSYKKAK